jgi:hypothetical protein
MSEEIESEEIEEAEEDTEMNEESESLFNATQYLLLIMGKHISDIHMAIAGSNTVGAKESFSDLTECVSLLDKAIMSFDESVSSEPFLDLENEKNEIEAEAEAEEDLDVVDPSADELE